MTKFKQGDRVEVTIVGSVNETFDGGRGVLLDNGVIIGPHADNSVRLRKVAPPKPEVGEVIDAERLKTTPWKAGSVVVDQDGYALMLTHDGHWLSQGGHKYLLHDFVDENVKVVHIA